MIFPPPGSCIFLCDIFLGWVGLVTLVGGMFEEEGGTEALMERQEQLEFRNPASQMYSSHPCSCSHVVNFFHYRKDCFISSTKKILLWGFSWTASSSGNGVNNIKPPRVTVWMMMRSSVEHTAWGILTSTRTGAITAVIITVPKEGGAVGMPPWDLDKAVKQWLCLMLFQLSAFPVPCQCQQLPQACLK